MARKEKTIIDIWVDHCLQDDSWTIKHREIDDETGKVIREISEPLTEEIVLSACKLFAKWSSLDSPHIIETPSGIFKRIGGGYFFPTATRDAEYLLLSEEESSRIINGPKPNMFKRAICKVKSQLKELQWYLKKWLGKHPRAGVDVSPDTPVDGENSGELPARSEMQPKTKE